MQEIEFDLLMISIKDLSLSFGSRLIFDKISFDIHPLDKIGLTGKNGEGKSTLLKLIIGELTPDSGTISRPKDLTIGYLPQHITVEDSTTVLEEAMKAFDDVLKLEEQFNQLNKQLANRTDFDSEDYLKLADKVAHLADRLHVLESSKIEQYTRQTLLGLGFEEKDFQRPTSEFSGGWRMRIEIAKLLLRKPKLFLLDEPTNHLDIESIIWLEDFLKNYKGAIVLISHDRRFLDSITNRTIEISKAKIYDYPVPFTKYQELRRQRLEHQRAMYENQQKKIKQTERFIERFRSKATKASQVQSRIKQLEKMDIVEIDELDTKTIRFSFPPAPRSGDIVVEIKNLSKAYGQHKVLDKINLTVERGEKIAFVGRNGEGKTTLARIIVGQLDYDGFLKIGHNVKIGYFAQNQEQMLDGSKTVYQTLEEVAPFGTSESQLRAILGSFLFGDDDVTKKVAVLSGGEKARLALARLVLQPYNLLILDEPTNHLDIYAKDVLKAALQSYDGTLVVVSHDRYFLKDLAQTVYEFHNHKIKQYKGGIDYFLEKKRVEDFYEFEKQQNKKLKTTNTNSEKDKTQDQKQLYLKRKELQRKINRVEKKIAENETKIEEKEQLIAQLEQEFQNPDNVTAEKLEQYQTLRNRLNSLMSEWEQLNNELEMLKTQLEKFN